MSRTHVEAQHVVTNAARWANNMVTEVLHNYGRYLSTEQRAALKEATAALSRFQLAKLPEGYSPV